MTLKHILVIATNAHEIGPFHRKTGFFFAEIAHPYDVFSKAGIAVEYATLTGGTVTHDGYDEKDPAQRDFLNSKSIRRLNHGHKLAEIDVLDYDAVFVPGGLGPMVDIARNPVVQAAIARAWDAGMIVAAVCHGPCSLLGVKVEGGKSLIAGRRLTGFSNAEEDGYADKDVPFRLETALIEEGAKYECTDPWQSRIVLDGRLMTGQNPASAGALAQAVVEVLGKAAQ